MRFFISNRLGTEKGQTPSLSLQDLVSYSINLKQGPTLAPKSKERAWTDPYRFLAIIDQEEFQALPAEMRESVIAEQEILHYPALVDLPLKYTELLERGFPAKITGVNVTHRIRVTGGGQPLQGAEVGVIVEKAGGYKRVAGTTGPDGICVIQFDAAATPMVATVTPKSGYWAMMLAGVNLASGIDCPALPRIGPLGWWYRESGHPLPQPTTGNGISIGVVDTGIGPHPALAHTESAGCFVDGQHHPDAPIDDVQSHGSGVAGIIGAQCLDEKDCVYCGGAPGARLVGARVYASANSGASSADIALAIDFLSSVEEVDIINLSFTAEKGSEIVRDAIVAAANRGTVCIAAAGNQGQRVLYPAAFEECVAIAPIGLSGWAPSGSVSAQHSPDDTTLHAGRYFAANFASHGMEVDLCAGGVGVVTTVPTPDGGGYAASDGSSLAAPVVCAALAVILSQTPGYTDLPRDFQRTRMARTLLQGLAKDLGLPSSWQGEGFLDLSQSLLVS